MKITSRLYLSSHRSSPTFISIILKKMKDEGLVTVDDDNHIRLTDAGRHVAERIYDRHNVLTELFILLGVSRDIASEDACKVEHDISDETFAMLKSHYRKLLEKSDKK